MGQPAAKQGDLIQAMDIHIIMVPSPGGPVPTPGPHPFVGALNGSLSQNVNVMGMAAAVQGSTADNAPPHLPIPPAGTFQKPPTNKGKIVMGSAKVLINGKPAARSGDSAMTCNDPTDLPAGTVMAVGSVLMG